MAALPFDASKLSPADAALYEAMVKRRKAEGAPFGGPYAALINHPELCSRIEELGFYLKFKGRLPREVYQFVVLSVARSTGAAFEWVDHVRHAEAAGVPAPVIAILQKDGLKAGAFEPPYDLAAQVLAATLAWQDVPQSVQDQCIAAFGVEAFVELVVLSGFYQMFAAVNQGFAVSPPEGAPKPF